MFTLLLFLGVSLFALYWWLSTKHPKSFPPGPRFPLPFLGDALAFRGDVFEGPKKMREKYGDIWGLWIGPHRTVYIHDYETMKVNLSHARNHGFNIMCTFLERLQQ